MQLRPGQKPPLGVVIDFDLRGIDDALALALLHGLDGKREARVAAVSVSRPSLKAAGFCDAVSKFYAGASAQFMRTLPVGMELQGKPEPEPMLVSVLARPEYKTEIQQLNDTADPAALIRNAFSAHHDGNCTAILAGPATNFLNALALPRVRDLAAAKVRLLTIVPDLTDLENTNKLLAAWPGEVVVVSPEIGGQIRYPGSSIETDFAWTQAHPVVDAYKAYQTMPYDAPTGTLAAVLHAVRPHEKFFKLSDPGSVNVGQGGQLVFSPSAGGKHRQLLYDPAQKERVVKVYTEIVSAKPVPRMPRMRPPDANKPKPDATKPAEAKPAEAKPPTGL